MRASDAMRGSHHVTQRSRSTGLPRKEPRAAGVLDHGAEWQARFDRVRIRGPLVAVVHLARFVAKTGMGTCFGYGFLAKRAGRELGECSDNGDMDHRQAGRYWEKNAYAWTLLSRQGWDVYRDAVNTPAFLKMLPDVKAKTGLDVGCGEGHNTRLLAERGARMFAVDIAPTFIRYAAEAESQQARAIRYAAASALELPFVADRFDFATAFMSLMDLPNHRGASARSIEFCEAAAFFSSPFCTRVSIHLTGGFCVPRGDMLMQWRWGSILSASMAGWIGGCSGPRRRRRKPT
jgi:hypothetical protein